MMTFMGVATCLIMLGFFFSFYREIRKDDPK